MKLTKENVAKLALPAGKDEAIHFDDVVPRFGIRVRPGSMRWIVQYRVDGKQRRVTVGDAAVVDADVARKEARRLLAKVELGHDVQAEKAQASERRRVTLGYVAGLYLDFHGARRREKTVRETTRYLRKSFAPLAAMPIDKIERKHVAARMGEISGESGAVAAARARAALSAMFAWAIREGLADTNPVAGTNLPEVPPARDRVLSAVELVDIWNSCRDDDYGRIVRLLILTGARRSEIGGMLWGELDEQGKWTLPASRAKNGRIHTLPLSPLALSIIEAVLHREDRDLLFGESAKGFIGWAAAKTALDERITAARQERSAEPMPAWVAHDIRRSVATHMAELGVQPHIIETLLNHAGGHKSGVAGVYNRASYEREVKAALALWADHVGALVEGRDHKVITLQAARG